MRKLSVHSNEASVMDPVCGGPPNEHGRTGRLTTRWSYRMLTRPAGTHLGPSGRLLQRLLRKTNGVGILKLMSKSAEALSRRSKNTCNLSSWADIKAVQSKYLLRVYLPIALAIATSSGTEATIIGCYSKKSLMAWHKGSTATKSFLLRQGKCLQSSERWKIVDSDETNHITILSVIIPPSRRSIRLWSYDRVGDD